MSLDEMLSELADEEDPSDEVREKAADALAFVASLHQFFVDTGMSTNSEPDVAELENLVDALHGELAASVLFLCAPSFSRVPDMLRVISTQLEKAQDDSVPTVIVKGYARLAKRIENTRQNVQSLTPTSLAKTSLDKA